MAALIHLNDRIKGGQKRQMLRSLGTVEWKVNIVKYFRNI